VHTEELKSNEVTETFSEILEFGGTNSEDLTDA